MAVLRVKSTMNDQLSNQMALMQLRWQQMRQFEFQSSDSDNRLERPVQHRSDKIYSAA